MSALLLPHVLGQHWPSMKWRTIACDVAYVFQRLASVGDFETGIARAVADRCKVSLRVAQDWIGRLVSMGRMIRKGQAVAFLAPSVPVVNSVESADKARPKRGKKPVTPWNGSSFYRKCKERFKSKRVNPLLSDLDLPDRATALAELSALYVPLHLRTAARSAENGRRP